MTSPSIFGGEESAVESRRLEPQNPLIMLPHLELCPWESVEPLL